MKIGIFARRERGEPSTPANWDKRHLPAPTMRFAFAAIETIDDFAPRWGAMGRSDWGLKIGARSPFWETVPNGSGTLRRGSSLAVPKFWIYTTEPSTSPTRHGRRFGEGTTTAKEWLDRGRGLLLSDGWAGLCDHLGQTMTTDDGPEDRAPLDDLMSYFAVHTDRLNYCHRLYTGQSIGSGMVEGGGEELGRPTTQADRCSVASQ